MKLFKTNNIDTVRKCQKEFAFELPSVILARHSEHFLIKYKACDNAFCILFVQIVGLRSAMPQ